jgi:hypothetical protein
MGKWRQPLRIHVRKPGSSEELSSEEDPRLAETRVIMTQLSPLDDMTAIVTLATYAEFAMTQLLRRSVKSPDALGKKAAGLGYRHLVPLCLAMGVLPPELEQPLLILAELRNNFAHDITYQITESQALRFAQALPRDIIETSSGATVRGQFLSDRVALALELVRILHAPSVEPKVFKEDLMRQVHEQLCMFGGRHDHK